jgi:hypothetical protein
MIQIQSPDRQVMQVNRTFRLKEAKTVEEAFAMFDAAVKADSEATETEIRRQMFQQAMGTATPMPKGIPGLPGFPPGPNGFPRRR